LTAPPGLAPCAVVHPPPPRFRSQVFTTSQRFASTPGLRGLVSCRSHPWGSFPPELSSSSGSRTPLGAACFHAVIRRASIPLALAHGHLTAGFTDARARVHACRIPTTASGPVSAALTRRRVNTTFPGPWTARAVIGSRRHRLHLLRSLVPPTKPHRTRHRSDETRPLLPWAFAPPEPCSDRAPDPSTPRTIPSVAG